MNQNEIDRSEWANPRNWRGGAVGLYNSSRDSRIIVPKRNAWMGWTLNAGRPLGRLLTLAAFVLAAIAIGGVLFGWW